MADSKNDDAIFSSLSLVLVGWVLLFIAPRWTYTPTLVLQICVAYSVLYTILLSKRVYDADTNPLPEGGGFDSLDAVYDLFRDRQVVLAGWTHYIAFDLFVGRYIVMDAQANGIPHLYICPLIPVTLMAGPIGLVGYTALKQMRASTNISIRRLGQQKLVRRIILSGLYIAVSLLCIQMVMWVFVFPSSIFAGFKWHDEMAYFVESRTEGVPVNTSLKYAGHAAVKATHILPSAIWSASIPFQLNPGLRQKYRALHRITGYAFFGTSLLLIIGIGLIDRRKLYWHLSDYPSIPPYEHVSGIRFFQQSALQYAPEYSIYALTLWFAFTAFAALAFARSKNFALHQRYVIRHVASGIWVAIQRLLLIILTPTLTSEAASKEAFNDCSFYGVIISFSCAELAIWALDIDHHPRPKQGE